MPSPHQRPSYGTYHDHDPRPQAPLHLHPLPKGHGPASSSTRISSVYSLSSLDHAPTFVKSVGQYDDLGRILEDGVTAGVVNGKGKEKDCGQEGQALAFWKGLELGPSRGGSRVTTPLEDVTPPELNNAESTPNPPTGSTAKQNNNVVPTITSRPMVVPREQWFIRRALLAKEQREGENRTAESEASASTVAAAPTTASSASTTRPATPSLASLLSSSLPPPPTASAGDHLEVEGYQPPAYFHLKPNNKGWQVLKNIGWDEHGGLGRGEGRGSAEVEPQGDKDVRGPEVKREDGVPHPTPMVVKERHSNTGKGETHESAIDLTLDSASESDSESSSVEPSNPHEQFGQEFIDSTRSANGSLNRKGTTVPGSGRTAPVATYLKTDLRGIGALSASERRRTLLRPSTLAASGVQSSASKRKRVTHTQEEIREATRDARLSGEGLVGEERVAYDKKRAKRDAKNDRQERQRWRQIINM